MAPNNNRVNYKLISANAILALTLMYFVFHVITGERGILAYFKFKHLIQQQKVKLEILQKERYLLEKQISFLHPNTFNKEFIDELARRDLGLIDPDEKVIYNK